MSRRALYLVPVAIAVLYGLVLLYPDFVIPGPESNDRVSQKTLVRYAVEQWDDHWAVDFWHPAIGGGFPIPATYHPLSHLTGATAARYLPWSADPARVYAGLTYLLLGLMPVSIFVSLRKLRLSGWAAATASFLYPLTGTLPEYGITWESFVHVGSGLLPQAWGVFFIFPALAWGCRAIREEGRWHTAGLLVALCTLSHLLYGYIAIVSLVLAALVPGGGRPLFRRLRRLGAILLVLGAGTAYFVIPLQMNSNLVLRSQWEPAWKWDSFGLGPVLGQLLRGDVFDGRGWPAISILVALGLVSTAVAVFRGRRGPRVWLLAGFVFWLFMFCGRAAWGGLTDLLLVPSGLHMHRLVGAVQIFGLCLAALGVESAGRWLADRPRKIWVIAGGLALAALLSGPALLRTGYMLNNARVATARRADLNRSPGFGQIVRLIHTLPPGRVHGGMYYDWGANFKIGDIPVFNHLQAAGFDMVGFPYNALAQSAEWQVRLDYRELKYCDLYNVRYVVAPASLPLPWFAQPRFRAGRFVLYEVPTSGYFALGRVESLPADTFGGKSAEEASWGEVYETGLRWLNGNGPLQRRYLAWSREPAPLSGDIEIEGQLEESVAPGRFGCRVRVGTDADLLLKASYHPGWRCTVDGESVPVTRVFPSFMAVRVPAGEHEVVFTYEPWVGKKPLFLFSLLMLAAGIAVSVATRVRRGRR